jgi:hypothetical protein
VHYHSRSSTLAASTLLILFVKYVEIFKKKKKKQGVCQDVTLPFTLQKYIKAKEEL